jgi:phosphatidylethanolamine-binding protein (PEBP) family uncharacterized protein
MSFIGGLRVPLRATFIHPTATGLAEDRTRKQNQSMIARQAIMLCSGRDDLGQAHLAGG